MGTERDSPGDSDGGGIHSLSKKVSDSRWFLGGPNCETKELIKLHVQLTYLLPVS